MESDYLSSTITDRRRQTRSSIYHYLYDSPAPRSKQEIARDLNLSLPTVYQNVSELLDAGFIEYRGSSLPSGGRPAMQLGIVKNVRCAVGINISGHILRYIAVNLAAEEIAYREFCHEFCVGSDEFCRYIADCLDEFILENHIEKSSVLGVGVSIPGIISQESPTVFYAPTLYLRNLSLQGIIDAIPYEVRLENDGDSGGFAEWFRQADRRNIAFISLSEGVGGAVLVNSDQYTGNNFRSGEFGHMCVEWNGRLCACGKRGCLEAYCSSDRLSTDLGITPDAFFSALQEGNEEYASIWEDYKKHLVIGLHNIRMALDCDIVLGGIISEYLDPYLPEIRSLLAETDPFDSECSYIRTASNPRFSGILGAPLGFIRDFLSEI